MPVSQDGPCPFLSAVLRLTRSFKSGYDIWIVPGHAMDADANSKLPTCY